jgi:hypothetical protein
MVRRARAAAVPTPLIAAHSRRVPRRTWLACAVSALRSWVIYNNGRCRVQHECGCSACTIFIFVQQASFHVHKRPNHAMGATSHDCYAIRRRHPLPGRIQLMSLKTINGVDRDAVATC